MSDTPRTDAAAIRCACSTYVVPSEFARELERENAALREDKERLREQLREANRLLVAFAPESARAAIDATKPRVGDDAIMRQHLNEGGTPT